ncbi:unnamed protein product [Ectocarpus sp. CCAP 1310/34]|nr:unnamed protein product [Ectocarpus sp. CCAP 1310/34]
MRWLLAGVDYSPLLHVCIRPLRLRNGWFEKAHPSWNALWLVELNPPFESLPHALAFLPHLQTTLSCAPIFTTGSAAISFAACSSAGVTTWRGT